MDEGYDAINLARARALVGRATARRPAHRRRSRCAAPGPGRRPRDASHVRRAWPLGAVARGRSGPPAVLAAVLRLPDLATRGTWDGDQGHDMLVLRAFVRDGVVPLLGPPTSIGDVHHGAWYYYLLAPAAFLTGGDSPLAIVATIAVAGIAAVGVAWWLGRSIGGPWAGLLAGLVLAVSTAAVDESTFIWNPNLIGLSSGLALVGTWLAWRGGSPWWWVLAAVGTAITMQCHVLGVALLPIVAVPLVLDARRRPLGRAVPLAIVGVVVGAYLPLLVNELTTRSRRPGPRWPTCPAAARPRPSPCPSASPSSGCGSCPGRWSGSSRRPSCRPSWPPPAVITIAVGRASRDAGGPLARARPAVVGGVPDRRGPEPGLGRARAAQRPLPRLRRSDGRRPRRAGADRARRRAPARGRPPWPASCSSRWSAGT